MEVLGMIGIRGLVTLIEAFDIMIRAARIKLVNMGQVDGDLVTTMVCGDVVACETATNAGVAVAQHIGELVSIHVVPRLHGSLEGVFPISFKGDSNI